jgi:hypothetical protein
MEEGFLLDGIDIQGRGSGMDQGIVGSAPVLPDPTEAAFQIAHPAAPWTELAFHLQLRKLPVIPGLHGRKLRDGGQELCPAPRTVKGLQGDS